MSTIHTRLAKINSEIKAITKSRRNQQQGFNFRGIDDVMNELHDLFAKNEVIILPEVKDFTTENRPTKSGGLQTFTRLRVQYTFIAPDGSSVSSVGIGEAMDSGDKGTNKAMSIALKYILLQMFLIPTEEQKDPDAFTPEETDFSAMAIADVQRCTSIEQLMQTYDNYPALHQDKAFMASLTTKKQQLKQK